MFVVCLIAFACISDPVLELSWKGGMSNEKSERVGRGKRKSRGAKELRRGLIKGASGEAGGAEDRRLAQLIEEN